MLDRERIKVMVAEMDEATELAFLEEILSKRIARIKEKAGREV